MPFTGAAPAPMSPIAALDPSIVVAQQQAQQAQAYAQALRQQSMEPIDTNQMVSGRVVKVSPFQAMAKMLEAGMAHYQQSSANQQQADLAARQGAMLQGLFGGGATPPPAAPTAPDTPAPSDAVTTALNQGAVAQPPTPDPSGDGSMVNNGGTGPTVANAQRLGAILATAGAPTGDSPSAASAAAPAPAGGGSLRMPGMSPSQAYAMYTLDPAAYMTELYKRTNNTTDATAALRAAGIDPNSPQGQAMLTSAATNATAPKLTSVRQGGAVVGPDGGVVNAVPNMAPGTTPIIQDGRVVGVQPLPGNAGALQDNSYATAMGAGGAKPMQVWDPKANNGAGGMVYSTEAQVAGAAGAPPVAGTPPAVDPAVATMPPSIRAAYNSAAANPQQQLALLNTYKATVAHQPADFSSGAPNQNLAAPPPAQVPVQSAAGNSALTLPPASPPAAPAAPSGPMAAGPPLGAVAGADTQATGAAAAKQAKVNDLTSAQSTGLAVISKLQNIDQLANTAVTGPQQDRREYITGLLSLLPPGTPGLASVQSANYDKQTATDLLEKNSAQIVAALRMGASSGGSDALQTLLSGANPNVSMTPAGIHDAVAQLVATQQANLDKAKILLPMQSSSPAGYANVESTFNAAADPRIWQWKNMPDGPPNSPAAVAKSAFAANLQKQDPQITKKIATLESMGALQ